jgi:hypothetical protein
VRFEFEFGIVLFFFLPLFRLENRIFLSRGVQVAGAVWHAATRTVVEVGDLVQRTDDGCTGRILGGQAVKRSGDAVCGLHRACADEVRMFLGWASKLRLTVCEWFGLKTTRTVFASLASKLVATVSSGLTSKSSATVFVGLASKPMVTVFIGLTSKPVATVSSSLASKPAVTIFCILASKLVATVSPGLTSKLAVDFLVKPQNQGGGGFFWFRPQNWQLWFGDFGLKITTTVF